MLKKYIFTILLVFLITAPTYADQTGNDLLRGCNAILKVADGITPSGEEHSLALYWTGYISGFIDSYVITLAGEKPTLYCPPPKGIEVGQSARIIAKYLKDNPKELHQSTRLCLMLALREAFPCDR